MLIVLWILPSKVPHACSLPLHCMGVEGLFRSVSDQLFGNDSSYTVLRQECCVSLLPLSCNVYAEHLSYSVLVSLSKRFYALECTCT